MIYRSIRTNMRQVSLHMACSPLGKGRYLLACLLIPIYFAVFFASPWYHSHSEKSHDALEGGTLHSHIPALSSSLLMDGEDTLFSSISPSYPSDDLDAGVMMHWCGSDIPSFVPHYSSPILYRNLFHSSRLVLQASYYDLPGTVTSPIPPALKSPQEYLPSYSPQELVILIGADLPPPIA